MIFSDWEFIAPNYLCLCAANFFPAILSGIHDIALLQFLILDIVSSIGLTFDFCRCSVTHCLFSLRIYITRLLNIF